MTPSAPQFIAPSAPDAMQITQNESFEEEEEDIEPFEEDNTYMPF
jgi:hypothetical protein